MACIVGGITNAMIRGASGLPDFQTRTQLMLYAKRKPPLINCRAFSRETSGIGVNKR